VRLYQSDQRLERYNGPSPVLLTCAWLQGLFYNPVSLPSVPPSRFQQLWYGQLHASLPSPVLDSSSSVQCKCLEKIVGNLGLIVAGRTVWGRVRLNFAKHIPIPLKAVLCFEDYCSLPRWRLSLPSPPSFLGRVSVQKKFPNQKENFFSCGSKNGVSVLSMVSTHFWWKMFFKRET